MNSTRKAIKRKHTVSQLKAQVRKFDERLERLKKRPLNGGLGDVYRDLQVTRDRIAREIFRVKKTEIG